MTELPLPPHEFRKLVGPLDDAAFDNPTGQPVLGFLDPRVYDSVLDFGCGCGRLARQMIQQSPRPRRYLGLDRHRGMVEWCRTNLGSRAPGFRFEHHDVHHDTHNDGGTLGHLPFPADDQQVTLGIAYSVFTHLLEPDAAFYISEFGRVLAPGGTALTTWFLFDKRDFPMMQDFQNALFINVPDPTNAVIFDRDWLRARVADAGLVMTGITAPTIRGFQWTIRLERREAATVAEATFPEDLAPRGLARPPCH